MFWGRPWKHDASDSEDESLTFTSQPQFLIFYLSFFYSFLFPVKHLEIFPFLPLTFRAPQRSHHFTLSVLHIQELIDDRLKLWTVIFFSLCTDCLSAERLIWSSCSLSLSLHPPQANSFLFIFYKVYLRRTNIYLHTAGLLGSWGCCELCANVQRRCLLLFSGI